MNGHWVLLINKQEKSYHKMRDGLSNKYLSRLNHNPNGITYKTFDSENEIDNRINDLKGQGYNPNSLLEDLAFDY